MHMVARCSLRGWTVVTSLVFSISCLSISDKLYCFSKLNWEGDQFRLCVCVCDYADKRQTGGTVECSLCVAVMQTLETSPPRFNTSPCPSEKKEEKTHTQKPGKSLIAFARCGKLWTRLLTLRRIKSIVPPRRRWFPLQKWSQVNLPRVCAQRKSSVISIMLIKFDVERNFWGCFSCELGTLTHTNRVFSFKELSKTHLT